MNQTSLNDIYDYLIPDINECSSDPCQNGGTCQHGQGDPWYNCTCLPEYTGKDCQSGQCLLFKKL